MPRIHTFLAVFAAAVLVCAHAYGRKATQVFQAKADIVASPVVAGGLIIVTSADSICYALNSTDYSVAWQYQSQSPLRSSALVFGDCVYLETGNAITCISVKDGSYHWRSPDNTCTRTTEVDRWDFHRSQPVIHDSIIYCGDDFGWIYGTDLHGKRVMEYHTGSFLPVRSTPSIDGNTMYFADWDGTLYGYGLAQDSVLLRYSPIQTKPYEHYGAATTPIAVGKEVLVWGGRTSVMHGYDYRSRLNRWRMADDQEAWLSGSPVFYDNNLLIASSDSKTLYCMAANSGQLKWKRQLDQNCFSAPLVTKKEIIIGDGNAYEDAYGIIYFMSRYNGTIMERITVKGGIFSSIVPLDKKTFLVGTLGGYLYKID